MIRKNLITAVALSSGFFLCSGAVAVAQEKQQEQQQQVSQPKQSKQQPADYAQQLVSSDMFSDAKIQSQQGQEIGTVQQVLLDPQEGRIAYVLMKPKAGQGMQVISWDSLKLQQQQQQQQSDQKQGQITLVLQQQGQQLTSPDMLQNAKIQTRQGQEIGTVERVLLDAQEGKLAYVLVKSETGPQSIVPWNALRPQQQEQQQQQQEQQQQQQQQQPGQMTLVLQGQIPDLKEAPRGDIPSILDREQGRLIHQYYGVAPYWEGGQQQQQQQQQQDQEKMYQEQGTEQQKDKKLRSIMD